MKHNEFLANTLLAGLLGLALLVCVAVRAFLPTVILPPLDIPAVTLVSLAALLAEHSLMPGTRRRYLPMAALAAAAFGLLPLAAGLLPAVQCLRTALAGGVVFPVVGFLFSSLTSRVTTMTAPLAGALGIYLAAQGFAGIFL